MRSLELKDALQMLARVPEGELHAAFVGFRFPDGERARQCARDALDASGGLLMEDQDEGPLETVFRGFVKLECSVPDGQVGVGIIMVAPVAYFLLRDYFGRWIDASCIETSEGRSCLEGARKACAANGVLLCDYYSPVFSTEKPEYRVHCRSVHDSSLSPRGDRAAFIGEVLFYDMLIAAEFLRTPVSWAGLAKYF